MAPGISETDLQRPNAPPITRAHSRRQQFTNDEVDPLLSDLSPSSTLDALISTSAVSKARDRSRSFVEASVANVTESERAWGIRAALAGKKIREWRDELLEWPWKKGNDPQLNGFERPRDEKIIQGYTSRVEIIRDDMKTMQVEELKEHVRQVHVRPEATTRDYEKLEDFTAIITATIVQSLPPLAQLHSLLNTWSLRLIVLRRSPPFLNELHGCQESIVSACLAIGQNNADLPIAKPDFNRRAFMEIQAILQDQTTHLGTNIDGMLDVLEGSQDTLPDDWIDAVDKVENDYSSWVVKAEELVLNNELAASFQHPIPTEQKSNPIDDNPVLEAPERNLRESKASVTTLETSTPEPIADAPEQNEHTPERSIGGIEQEANTAEQKPRTPVRETESSQESDLETSTRAKSELTTSRLFDGADSVPPTPGLSNNDGLKETPIGGQTRNDDTTQDVGDPVPSKDIPPSLQDGQGAASQFDEGEELLGVVSAPELSRGIDSFPNGRFDPIGMVPTPRDPAFQDPGHEESPSSQGSLISGASSGTSSPEIMNASIAANPGSPIRVTTPLSPRRMKFEDNDDSYFSSGVASSTPLAHTKSVRDRRISRDSTKLYAGLPRDENGNSISSARPRSRFETYEDFSTASMPLKLQKTRLAKPEVNRPPTPTELSPPRPKDKLEARISTILHSIPADIRLKSSGAKTPPPSTALHTPNQKGLLKRSVTPKSRPKTPTSAPALTLAPASSGHDKGCDDSGIKVYHLQQPGVKESTPVKLYVRLVGESGERVMVRVGGGWADLGEYLKEYALHHGSTQRSISDYNGQMSQQNAMTPSPAPGTPKSRPSSRSSWADAGDAPSPCPPHGLGLAGPKGKDVAIEPSHQAWVDDMLEQATVWGRTEKSNEEIAIAEKKGLGWLGRAGSTSKVFLRKAGRTASGPS
ncbi:uncharacterized protein KY384_003618 [Bacidia gigantensis]|uniref:uncharacterized protein n=1 Tax=Bacidia gigantensis TaxID=2732470 RepID=UPI001D054077|nr:uncharacterized protein KY384_003618 [Bacidia gigantensis]KAG8531982.1 hypothetical protein KY384_003618 [Bacidia gigantensis]